MKKNLKSPFKYYFLLFHPTREHWDEGVFILNNPGDIVAAKCEQEAISQSLGNYIELITSTMFYKGKKQSGWELFVKMHSGYTSRFVRVIPTNSTQSFKYYYNPNKLGIYTHLMEGHRDYWPNAAVIKGSSGSNNASTTTIVKDLSNEFFF